VLAQCHVQECGELVEIHIVYKNRLFFTQGSKKKDYFFDKKKVQLFFTHEFHAAVSDFSAMRVRVEGVGSPRVAEKVMH
jgi:hypothetical protein